MGCAVSSFVMQVECAVSRRQLRPLKLTTGILGAADSMSGDFILDGELVGGCFIAFDVQRLGNSDVSALPMNERWRMLASASPFAVVRGALRERAKRALVAAVRAEGGEGVVFKRLSDAVSNERDGGVKFKNYRVDSFTVESVDIARCSAKVSLAGVGEARVVFPFKSIWPKPGELADVRFDCVSRHGKLMRARWLGVRNEIP